MNNNIKLAGIIVLIILFAGRASAQVALQGEEYLLDKTYINPAFAGMQGKLNANVFFQLDNTGPASSNNSNTVAAAVDGSLNSASSGGVDFLQSRFGSDTYTVAHLTYAYHLNLSSTIVMSTGASLGLEQFGIDLLNLQTVSGNDPSAQSSQYSSKVDARVGVMLQSESKYYAGISFDNLVSVYNTNEISYTNSIPDIYRKVDMYIIAGSKYDVTPTLVIRPSVLFMQSFGGMSVWEVNGLFDLSDYVTLGLSYRQNIYHAESVGNNSSTQSVFRPMVQLNISKNHALELGYSYSINAGNSYNVNSGSNNLSLVYNVPKGL